MCIVGNLRVYKVFCAPTLVRQITYSMKLDFPYKLVKDACNAVIA